MYRWKGKEIKWNIYIFTFFYKTFAIHRKVMCLLTPNGKAFTERMCVNALHTLYNSSVRRDCEDSYSGFCFMTSSIVVGDYRHFRLKMIS
jgi:hypothetical protein